MKNLFRLSLFIVAGVSLLPISSCRQKSNPPSAQTISTLNLKRGEIVLCGAPERQLGKVDFEITGPQRVKDDFNQAVALLHSFEYDEAEKAFSKVIDGQPGCAMAYWGVAMCNNHPLWTPPTEAELKKGARAIAIAQSISGKTKRESEYIDAMAQFYKDWDKDDHLTRSVRFEKGMEKTYRDNPGDKEAAIFYALALDAAASPTDKTFANQKKAGAILTSLYPGEQDHPGIVHYIIHTYDYPELASLALPAARKYASIAPSSAHAQHMPSHIFTRLGLWDECIESNKVSVSYARCYAGAVGIKGHWDEELHGLDYLVYAYLQKAENKQAKAQCDYLKTINLVYPINFKDAYAFAAIPARYVVENKLWGDAANLKLTPVNFPWKNFPWQTAIFDFSRLLGFVHIDKLDSARTELARLQASYDTLTAQKDAYKAMQVKIQITAGQAWIKFKEGKNDEALKLMVAAAEMEGNTQKHPVTPCEIVPAQELLADMLLEMNKPQQALHAYEADLQKHPNRFNGLYGAATSAKMLNNWDKADYYYQKLVASSNAPGSGRPELDAAKSFLKTRKQG